MSIPKGTKPNQLNWVECDEVDLAQALRNIQRAEPPINVVLQPGDYHAVWQVVADGITTVVARAYNHKRSTRCLIAVQFKDYLPKPQQSVTHTGANKADRLTGKDEDTLYA